MHPDEAVHLAIQDLRNPAGHIAPSAPHEHAPSRAFELLRGYFAPLRWYVQDGRTPPSADPGAVVGHLPRPRFAPERTAVEALPVLALEACA